MNCTELTQLQGSLAALVLANETQEQIALAQGVTDAVAYSTFHHSLQEQLQAARTALARHVSEHKCAN